MKPIRIYPLKREPIVRFSGKNVVLPSEIQGKIDEYWQTLIESGKSYTRGDVFTVTRVDEDEHVLVEKTDYAHYLYCQNIDTELEGYGIRVIFTACLVETLDGKTVFGKMGRYTARSGMYQLCGGGIDSGDLIGEEFNLGGNIAKELQEELGVDVSNTVCVHDFKSAYLKEGGKTGKIAVIYRVLLNETTKDFINRYKVFESDIKRNGGNPEFDEIVVLNQDCESIEDFLEKFQDHCDEYMAPLLRYVYC